MSTAPETIKERLSIADVIGSYIKLEKAGINFKAKCPFHNEKTPSFHISPTRGSYYCFGCGAKGDIFTFVEQFEGLDFKGALKVLAERAGVSLEDFRENKTLEAEKKNLYSALEEATSLFEEQLQLHPQALEYITKRGLNQKTIQEWRIGYALPEWRSLKTKLVSHGTTEAILEKAGLVKRALAGKESYDVFRGRIMFPIFDSAGRVIAFSGRIIVPDDTSPKYLNSPDTPLFNKSEVLYGLHKAKVPIRRKGYSILVEGQMDLLMSHQAGFDNTVATSGTALTPEHAKRLKSLSPNILLVFDGDEAGFKASGRAGAIVLPLGMEVKLGILPQGVDPADLILKDKKAWGDVIKGSKNIIDFYLEHSVRRNSTGRKLIKEIETLVFPLIRGLGSELDKAHYIAKIRDITSLPEEALWQELRKSGDVKQIKESIDSKEEQSTAPPQKESGLFDFGLGVLLSLQEKHDIREVILREFLYTLCGKDRFEGYLQSVETKKDVLMFEVERAYPEGLTNDALDGLKEELQKAFFKKEREELTREIRKAEASGDTKRVEELSLQFNTLMKRK